MVQVYLQTCIIIFKEMEDINMDLIERFLKYVKVDTQSQPESSLTPSTLKQLNLGKILVEELHALGLEDAYLSQEIGRAHV